MGASPAREMKPRTLVITHAEAGSIDPAASEPSLANASHGDG